MDRLGRRQSARRLRFFSGAAAAALILVTGVVLAAAFGGDRDGPLRRRLQAVTAPIFKIVSWPARLWRAAGEDLADHWAAVERVRALEDEVRELRGWRAEALRLRRLNARYEALVGIVSPPDIERVGGRVIAESSGPFVRTVLIDVGRSHGVAEGHAVMDAAGLLGRTVNVSERASRVLLVTDLNSRIPVEVIETRAKAILAGDNTTRPRLQYMTPAGGVRPGDVLVTSGDGRLFPPGLPVGRAVAAEDGLRVGLFAAAGRTDHAVALLYEFPSIEADGS